MACREVEEVDRGRVEMNVEAVLDTLEDCGLVDIVVTGIDDASSFGVALLCRTNRCPQDSFTAAASIAVHTVSTKVVMV